MKTGKEQVRSSAIDVLAHTEFPVELSGTKLYGEAKTESGEPDAECRLYKLSNETGTGKITAYRVFSGVELYYNDMHMAYCNKDQMTAKNMIEINHCLVGRYECSFGENSCCYMAAGDLSIGSVRKKKSFSCFPLKHYHGITVVIDLEKILRKSARSWNFWGSTLRICGHTSAKKTVAALCGQILPSSTFFRSCTMKKSSKNRATGRSR